MLLASPATLMLLIAYPLAGSSRGPQKAPSGFPALPIDQFWKYMVLESGGQWYGNPRRWFETNRDYLMNLRSSAFCGIVMRSRFGLRPPLGALTSISNGVAFRGSERDAVDHPVSDLHKKTGSVITTITPCSILVPRHLRYLIPSILGLPYHSLSLQPIDHKIRPLCPPSDSFNSGHRRW